MRAPPPPPSLYPPPAPGLITRPVMREETRRRSELEPRGRRKEGEEDIQGGVGGELLGVPPTNELRHKI